MPRSQLVRSSAASSATSAAAASCRAPSRSERSDMARAEAAPQPPSQSSSNSPASKPMTPYIGTATSRVDGRAKVTGAAKYAAEFNAPDLAYGSVVGATITKGRITRSMRARRCASKACSTCSPTRTGRRWRTRTRPTRTTWRRTARRSGRSTTTRSCSTASRSRWSSPKTRRPRASRHRWSAWNTTRKRTSPTSIASATLPFRSGSHKSDGGRVRAAEDARQSGPGAGRGRGAPRGRIFRSDRASQPDGALCLDGGLRGGRQAHGLRQDPGRAERAEISLRRVRHEARGCARHVALHGRRLRLGPAPAVPGGAGGAGGARAEALGAGRADARSRCMRWATGRR